MSTDERHGVQSVEVAMRVLSALEEARGPATLSALASLAELQPAKVHRYLVSLTRVGLAEQEHGSGLYTLGPATRRLGIEALRRGDEVTMATPHLLALRDATQHTANLATWSDAGPVIVRWDYGAYPLPITVRVGSTLPLVESSVGQVFMANLPTPVTRGALREQQKRGETSTPSEAELADSLADVRARGYALTSGAILPGLTVISAPVVAGGLGVALVASLVAPTISLSVSTQARMVEALLSAAAAITRDLGGE